MWNVLYYTGRVILGLYYISSGLQHFINLNMMAQYTASKNVPLPQLAVIVTGILLLVAGATFLTGYYPRVGVIALIIFFVPVTIIMHNFWAYEGMERFSQQINFMKNFALLASSLIFSKIENWNQ